MIRKNILLSLTTVFFLYSCGEKKESENKEVAHKVTIQTVASQNGAEYLNYSGTIEADNTVMIGFLVSGKIINVNVQEGQHITTGQLLASVEQQSYQYAYDIAKATFIKAEDNFNRLKELYDKKSLPESDFIAAKSGLMQAKANVSLANKQLKDTRLYAPFSGIITQKITDIGATAAPGVPAFTIVKTDRIYATASITESEISLLKIGTAATINVPSAGKEMEGRVTLINPQGDNLSKTFLAKIRLDNPGGQLLPGMIANIHINTGKSLPEIVVPSKAVLRDLNNISYVFVTKDNKTAFKKRVTVTRISGVENVVIGDGLALGEKLIVTGVNKIEDGSPIQL